MFKHVPGEGGTSKLVALARQRVPVHLPPMSDQEAHRGWLQQPAQLTACHGTILLLLPFPIWAVTDECTQQGNYMHDTTSTDIHFISQRNAGGWGTEGTPHRERSAEAPQNI